MRPKLITFSLLTLFIATAVWARPPKNLELTYDFTAQSLHLEVDHIVDDRNEDYIRKVVIRVNGLTVKTKYNRKQNDTFKYVDDFSISAEDGDVIKVKVYSSEGGTATAEITAVEPEEDDE